MKIVHILFQLLILTSSVFSQTYCDTLDGIFCGPRGAEDSPRCNISDNELMSKLNTEINPIKFENFSLDVFFIISYVNCIGEDFGYKLYKRDDNKVKQDTISEFQEILLSSIQSIVSFNKPGQSTLSSKGLVPKRAVDYQLNYYMRIHRNKIYILNRKEEKKYFKKQRQSNSKK